MKSFDLNRSSACLRTSFQRGSLLLLLLVQVATAQSPDIIIDRTVGNPKFKAAQEFLEKNHDRFVKDLIQLTEIEAPPFKESKRAEAYLELMKPLGLNNVEIDPEGNVLGLRKGTGGGPLIAIAAHLDTVFPEGTDVKVRQQGTRLSAPGVGDDTSSLAVMLALIRALNAANVETRSDILFVADVGEEGPGDLRGMKYLFQKGPYKDKIRMFISMDGTGSDSIAVKGVGSKRYRVTFKGPGGHSYAAFGLVNPAYALARAMNDFSNIQVPEDPRTTFNVGTIGGGTSVNSIPFESWMEVDMRSESATELAKENDTFLGLMRHSADEENKARSTAQGKITVDVKLTGDRPLGTVSIGTNIVQTASAAIREFGLTPAYVTSSTDANIPMSMRIPAITIGSGGEGGRAHALDEWIDVERTSSLRGQYIALATLLGLAGIQ
jgi:acetylornithine deacetylase/succinyl-diaminopimelate desuccinylase-like protein